MANSINFESNLDMLAYVATVLLEDTCEKPTICKTVPKKRKYFEDDNENVEFSYNGYPVTVIKSLLIDTEYVKQVCLSKASTGPIYKPKTAKSTKSTKSAKTTKSAIPIASKRPTRISKPTKIFSPTKTPTNRPTRSTRMAKTTTPIKTRSSSRSTRSLRKEVSMDSELEVSSNSLDSSEDASSKLSSTDTSSSSPSSEEKKINAIKVETADEDLVPLVRKRKRATKTPEELKDEEYFIKRQRNNEAAKRSRDQKNQQIKETEMKVEALIEEREQIDQEFNACLAELFYIRQVASQCPEKAKQLEDALENHPELTIMKTVLRMPLSII